ncbi:hypothetical protein EXU85_24480 [Spirosoma sp. KCTC 42546]|uniref:hypothetical protein n=1 Tax=Spirosoma sp. KCTC 42546 TaxID=2520506 RepID=UPI001157C4F6|nr:hypothetical protein [Spirosoma sp. KCTC 42546]QDK81596.1 hypothetical protein EXU85_24480 [Spirosoma sp. KCTC 42546]
MKYSFVLFLLGLGALLGFAGYCYALIDWVQDYRTGVYHREPFEACCETSALVVYTVLGLRFTSRKLNS